MNALEGPVLVHVMTTKGKGYPPAEKNPAQFHGVGPFASKPARSPASKGGAKSYTGVFGDTMVKLAAEDDKIIAITAAMPDGTGLTPFAKAFPDRFFDVGIAEQHALTFAAGLAAEGFRPVAAIYSSFTQRAYDQVFHDICLQKLPVTLALDRAGSRGGRRPDPSRRLRPLLPAPPSRHDRNGAQGRKRAAAYGEDRHLLRSSHRAALPARAPASASLWTRSR